jgi:hypothetical protein
MITLHDLLPLVEALRRLQLDQVQSVAERDTNEDSYNYSHLITIRKTLARYNEAYAPYLNFDEDIAFVKQLLSDRANEVMNG